VTVQVFVSYRRGDSPHAAGRLKDQLNDHFKLYLDVVDNQPGVDFTVALREALDQTDVLVAVIGSQWLTLKAENGGRRIDQQGDWVAGEIGTALHRDTPVIPVLIDGAKMPSRDELPPALADLANRQALRITHDSFRADADRLIQAIKNTVNRAKPETLNLWEDPDYPDAVAASLQGRWPIAIEGFERVLRRHPRQTHVVEQLEQARSRQRLLDLDATAQGAAEAGRWQEAVEALEAINGLQSSDDVTDRLDEARRKLRITELQNVVRALARNRNWGAVLAAETELVRLDSEAGDPDGLASRARAELLEAELRASYAKGVQQLNEPDWAGAEATFRALLDRQPSYRDAEGLLALARRQGRPEEKHQPKSPASKPEPTDSALLQEEVGRQAAPAVQHESSKYGRWIILLTLAGLLLAGAIIGVSGGFHSGVNPTQTTTSSGRSDDYDPSVDPNYRPSVESTYISGVGRPEDYDELLSHLPTAERSTCRRAEQLHGTRIALAFCENNSYSLFRNVNDLRSGYSYLKKGDCSHFFKGYTVYEDWAKNGRSGILSCSYYNNTYGVQWTIDQLGIEGNFFTPRGAVPTVSDYQELLSEALRVRDEVT
jgi:hypothetical protein